MIQLGKKAIITAVSTLVLFGAVIAGVAIASAEDFAPVHAPDWKAGYSFSYDAFADIQSVTEGNVADEFGLPGQANLSFGPFPVKKEILSTQYEDSDGYPVYVSAATFPFSNLQSGVPIFDQFAGQQAFVSAERQGDLAPLPIVPDTSCRSDACPSGGLNFLAGNDMTYLNFPLSPDKRWEQTIDLPLSFVPEELKGIDRMHVVGQVSGMETVDMGDFGTTEAVRVDFSYTPVGLQEFVSEFAQTLEDAGLELERFNFQVGLHEIVHYSDELQAVVQHEYILYTFVDIAAKGEVYGYEVDHDIFAEVTARIQLKLTGANTVEGKERTPLEILEIVGDSTLIADARGQGVRAGGYTISMDSTETWVNAADGQDVLYFVNVDGIDALPHTADVQFTVRDADGEVVKRGDNREGFIFRADQPGVYHIQATVTDGDLVKTAQARLVADWHEVVEARCSISLLGTECEPHEFPVAPGLSEMTVMVESNGFSPAFLGDYMVIDYADGETEMFGDAYAYYDAGLDGHGAGAWAVSYQADSDYLAQARYTVSASYGGPIDHADEAEPAPEGGEPRGTDAGGAPSFMVEALGGLDRILSGL